MPCCERVSARVLCAILNSILTPCCRLGSPSCSTLAALGRVDIDVRHGWLDSDAVLVDLERIHLVHVFGVDRVHGEGPGSAGEGNCYRAYRVHGEGPGNTGEGKTISSKDGCLAGRPARGSGAEDAGGII